MLVNQGDEARKYVLLRSEPRLGQCIFDIPDNRGGVVLRRTENDITFNCARKNHITIIESVPSFSFRLLKIVALIQALQ